MIRLMTALLLAAVLSSCSDARSTDRKRAEQAVDKKLLQLAFHPLTGNRTVRANQKFDIFWRTEKGCFTDNDPRRSLNLGNLVSLPSQFISGTRTSIELVERRSTYKGVVRYRADSFSFGCYRVAKADVGPPNTSPLPDDYSALNYFVSRNRADIDKEKKRFASSHRFWSSTESEAICQIGLQIESNIIKDVRVFVLSDRDVVPTPGNLPALSCLTRAVLVTSGLVGILDSKQDAFVTDFMGESYRPDLIREDGHSSNYPFLSFTPEEELLIETNPPHGLSKTEYIDFIRQNPNYQRVVDKELTRKKAK
jgi:hypothetical protein